MASGNVVFRGFTLFLHPGSCDPEGGKKERRGENDGCSCEVTPHAENRGKCQWEKGIERGEGGKGRREKGKNKRRKKEKKEGKKGRGV